MSNPEKTSAQLENFNPEKNVRSSLSLEILSTTPYPLLVYR